MATTGFGPSSCGKGGGHATQEAFARLVRQKVRRSDQHLTCRRHALSHTLSLSLSLALPLARARARAPSRSRSRSGSLSCSLALNLSLALPCDLARGCQRLVCMLGRDRERESLQGTRTCNTLSRAEDTCGMGTMSCHSGREEYATHGIRSPSLPSGGVTRAGP